MKKYMMMGMLAVVIMVLILTACSLRTNAAQDADGTGELPPVAVVMARESLAAHLGLNVEEIPSGSYERVEWTDSCLGLGGPAESCLAAMYPGWRVVFEVDGTGYEVRTDELGDIIRIK